MNSEISSILNSPMTIGPLTLYEWERNRVGHTGRDQHCSEFTNDNLTTYKLWKRERAIGWNRQVEISTIVNSPMTIRSLTSYEWESNTVEQAGRDQHHSEFLNVTQTTYRLWMREQQGVTNRQRSAPFWIPQWQSDHLQTINWRGIG